MLCAVLVALTGDTTDDDTLDGVNVLAKDDGNEVIFTEEWSPALNNMEQFHSNFDKSDDIHQGNEEDFILRKVAMKSALCELKGTMAIPNGIITSVHHVRLPFKADPSSMKINFMGTEQGCRCVHVNLCEKVKVEGKKLKMMKVEAAQTPRKAACVSSL